MQPQATKNALSIIVQCILFGAAGLLVGSMTIGVVKFFQPGLDAFWDWLGPLLGTVLGIGFLLLIGYIRKHPEGVR